MASFPKKYPKIIQRNKLLLLSVLYLWPGGIPLYWQLHPNPYNMLLRVGEMKFPLKENSQKSDSNKLLIILSYYMFNLVEFLYTKSYTNIPVICC